MTVKRDASGTAWHGKTGLEIFEGVCSLEPTDLLLRREESQFTSMQ